MLAQPQLPEPDRVLCVGSLHDIAFEIIRHRDDHLRQSPKYNRRIVGNDLLAFVQSGGNTGVSRG